MVRRPIGTNVLGKRSLRRRVWRPKSSMCRTNFISTTLFWAFHYKAGMLSRTLAELDAQIPTVERYFGIRDSRTEDKSSRYEK